MRIGANYRRARGAIARQLSPRVPKNFDEVTYLRLNPDVASLGLNGTAHYLMFGRFERHRQYPVRNRRSPLSGPLGRLVAPFRLRMKRAWFDLLAWALTANRFDVQEYLDANPDAVGWGHAAEHYVRLGRSEGRSLVVAPLLWKMKQPQDKSPAIIVCHEASKTGAPLLGLELAQELSKRLPVVAVILRDGPLVEDFARVCSGVIVEESWRGPVLSGAETVRVRRLLQELQPKFALCNSIETSSIVGVLSTEGVATVGLIHEFPQYTRPTARVSDFLLKCDRIVFSSHLQADAFVEAHAIDEETRTAAFTVRPQGQTGVPVIRRRPTGVHRLAPVILGAGSVQPRKGVDLFMQLADRMHRTSRFSPRFTWVGKWPDKSDMFDPWLAYQRGLMPRGSIEFVDEVDEDVLQQMIADAEIFVVTSRMDPLPNVALLALVHGTPVVSFDGATGVPELQARLGLSALSVPYLDVAAMADVIDHVLSGSADPQHAPSPEHVINQLSVKNYADDLVGIVSSVSDLRKLERRSLDIITESGLFDHEFHDSPHLAGTCSGGESCIHRYVRSWRAEGRRRPMAGFNPEVYRDHHPKAGLDPFAHFIVEDAPLGPWSRAIIPPGEGVEISMSAAERVAVHLHVHHAEEAQQWLDSLDLWDGESVILTATSADVADHLEDICSGRGPGFRIVRDENRGRNIGALYRLVRSGALDAHDAVLHLHTKRSEHSTRDVIQQWVDFLRTSLTDKSPHGSPGRQVNMHRRILARMLDDDRIGAVFPCDPNLIGWGLNRDHAERLRGTAHLPTHFDFPVGAMFAARLDVLKHVFASVVPRDLPPEPVPYDGTTLHAVERLMGIVPADFGLSVLNSYVPGTSR